MTLAGLQFQTSAHTSKGLALGHKSSWYLGVLHGSDKICNLDDGVLQPAATCSQVHTACLGFAWLCLACRFSFLGKQLRPTRSLFQPSCLSLISLTLRH